jgi:hypothetical protein
MAQDCPEGKVCVDKADMPAFIQLARDQKCRAEQSPKVIADDVSIVLDRQGRVYGSGTGLRPFAVRIDWCNYQLEAKTELQVLAAQRVEPSWGFRLRLKPAFGVLVPDVFRADLKGYKALDGGLLVEPFYVYDVNLNAYVGLRSFGVGLGYDITKNMTAYVGYSAAWDAFRPNLLLGVGFSLW